MSFIDLPGDYEDVTEPVAAPADGGYTLRVIRSDLHHNDDTGNDSIRNIIEIDGHPEYANVFHYVALPNSDDPPDKRRTKNLMMKRFLYHFGVPVTEGGINTEEIVGCVWENGRLGQDEYQGVIRNVLNLPPLPKEAN